MNALPCVDSSVCMEDRLLELLSTLIGTESLSVDSNLLDVGLNSLLIALLCSQIQTDFGTQISALDVYRHPSVRSLATAIEDLRRTSAQPLDETCEVRTGWFP